MKKIQIFANIIFITFLLFILANLLLGIVWEIRTKIKLNYTDFKAFDKVVRKALDLNEEDSNQLYIETYIQRKYDYVQWVEHAENNGYDNKFVNVTPKLGRKTISPKNCEKTVFFYGGSTAFGYGVTDNQTIASYLGQIFINNKQKICVKNFGRGSYFSTQETILFQKHLLNKEINKSDIIIFLDGINENGNSPSRNTGFLYEAQKVLQQRPWDMYKLTFPTFIESLPVSQFINRLITKYKAPKRSEYQEKSIFDIPKETKFVYEQNILLRDSICKKLNINCYNLLQPFASVHGKYFDKPSEGIFPNMLLQPVMMKQLEDKYKILKNSDGIIDISDAFSQTDPLSYIDGIHYSPSGNRIIAERVYDIIKDDLL